MLDYDIYAQRITGAGELVATLLASWDAAPSADGISLRWRLSSLDGGVRFAVLRARGETGAFGLLDAGGVRSAGLEFFFDDASVEPGSTYRYRVAIEGGPTLFETVPLEAPRAALVLSPNRPNPFNPSTTISFEIPRNGRVRLTVHDVTGRLVATLLDEDRAAGRHAVSWNGANGNGRPVAAGAYFCRLSSGKKTVVRKMVLVR